jgi:hypothetical protein
MASRPPSAPSRPRRTLTTRSTPAASAPSNKHEMDQLADELGASLKISKRPAAAAKSLVPSATTKRPPPAVKAPAKPAPTSRAAPSKQPSGSLAKSTTPSTIPPPERAKSAMKQINASLQALFALKKSGWRASASSSAGPTPSSSRAPSTSTVQARASSSSLASNATAQASKDKAEAETKACAAGLKELRELIRDRLIGYKATDVERAAGSLIGHLLDMELVRFLLAALFAEPSELTLQTNAETVPTRPHATRSHARLNPHLVLPLIRSHLTPRSASPTRHQTSLPHLLHPNLLPPPPSTILLRPSNARRSSRYRRLETYRRGARTPRHPTPAVYGRLSLPRRDEQ